MKNMLHLLQSFIGKEANLKQVYEPEIKMIVSQIVILFLIMLVGLISRKKNVISKDGIGVLTSVIVNIASPAMVLKASINVEASIAGKELITASVISGICYLILLVLAPIIPRILKIRRSEHGVYKAMLVFSNIGFMGFPVIESVYGSEALLFATFFMIPYSFLMYTYGINVMKKEGKEKQGLKDSLKQMMNIGFISCVLTLVLYLAKIPVPLIVEKPIAYIGNITSPLSMIVIGASIADMKFGEVCKDWKMLVFILIKQVILPVIMVYGMLLFDVDALLCGTCMIVLATPVGSLTAMIAREYDGDYELCSKGVALSTLLSVITMPLVSFLVRI